MCSPSIRTMQAAFTSRMSILHRNAKKVRTASSCGFSAWREAGPRLERRVARLAGRRRYGVRYEQAYGKNLEGIQLGRKRRCGVCRAPGQPPPRHRHARRLEAASQDRRLPGIRRRLVPELLHPRRRSQPAAGRSAETFERSRRQSRQRRAVHGARAPRPVRRHPGEDRRKGSPASTGSTPGAAPTAACCSASTTGDSRIPSTPSRCPTAR